MKKVEDERGGREKTRRRWREVTEKEELGHILHTARRETIDIICNNFCQFYILMYAILL